MAGVKREYGQREAGEQDGAASFRAGDPGGEQQEGQAHRKVIIEEAPGEIRVVGEERAGQRRNADSAEQRALNRRRPQDPHGDSGAEEKLGRRFHRQQLRQQGHDQFRGEIGDKCPMDGIERGQSLRLGAACDQGEARNMGRIVRHTWRMHAP
jgi:hypothetical protein